MTVGVTRIVLCALLALAIHSMAAVAKADGDSPSPRPTAQAPSSDGEAKEVTVYLFGHRRAFQLELFPTKGVAVIDTLEIEGQRAGRSVAYAMAVPAAPFGGSIDLTFPGLGRIVGTVSAKDPLGPSAQAKRCEAEVPSESATFEGRLAFRGAGGYGRWAATKAKASIQLACGGKFRRENEAAALFEHVSEFGPVLNGPASIRLSAEGEVGHGRSVRLFAWGSRDYLEFVAIDSEWLPGRVAALRWAKKEGASPKSLAIRHDESGHVTARLTPPAPFFGEGIYRRRAGDLTGSIGVNFLGLKLHLAPSPLPLIFEDEEDLGHPRAEAPTWLVPPRR